MNRDVRLSGRSQRQPTQAPLPPRSEVDTTHPFNVAQGAVTNHFDRNSSDVPRPRVAGLDVDKMQITTTARLCEFDMAQPPRPTREHFGVLPQGLGELTEWLLAHSVTAAVMASASTSFSTSQSAIVPRPVGVAGSPRPAPSGNSLPLWH